MLRQLSQAPAAPVKAPASPAQFSGGAAEILKMQEAGIAEGVIKAYVEHAPVVYHLSPDEIIALLRRGVSSDIVVAMLYKGEGARAQRDSAQPVAPAPPPRAQEASTRTVQATEPKMIPDPKDEDAYLDASSYYADYYPSYSYVSLGWGWPRYSYRYGWPGSGYRYGGGWGGAHYGGPGHYSAPPHAGTGGHVGFGGSSHSSGGISAGGRGGASHGGR